MTKPLTMEDVSLLNCDAIECMPQAIDWTEALGENLDGWRSFEAVTCPTCDRTIVVSDLGTCSCREALPEITEEIDGEEIETANTCRGTIENEGPMMSYWYPVRIDDCEDAARAIAHLPLCVVEFEDGRTGLALTGGGMDLSWEICEAFVRLGYWPPTHFADLPAMADRPRGEHDLALIAACEESCRIAEGWIARKRERLAALRTRAK